ncbi:RICIN domain-containing protein [Streptomyces sp. NPDC021096]|uniref:RICIN domain-containing protein n=1 Tax=Streptomyces sp. NPDC021096 TaxID=3154792 RepID=UPI0033C8A20B
MSDVDEGSPARWRNAAAPGLCLTAEDRVGFMYARPCANRETQLWWRKSREVSERHWQAPGPSVRIRSANGDYLAPYSSRDRSNLYLFPGDRPNSAQLWDIRYTDYSDNLVKLVEHRTGKCADVRANDRAGPGSAAVIFRWGDARTNNDNTGRRWRAESDKDGKPRFRNEATHLCLAAPTPEGGGDPGAERRGIVDECANTPQQWWTVERA